MLEGSTSTRLHQLPVPATEFIGRQHEAETVREQLSVARLVTITGPGGSGKTRLALEIASRRPPEFAEVAWCGLEAATDPPTSLKRSRRPWA